MQLLGGYKKTKRRGTDMALSFGLGLPGLLENVGEKFELWTTTTKKAESSLWMYCIRVVVWLGGGVVS